MRAGHIPPPPGAPGMAIQWMSKPNMIQGCPPGLEYLSQINKILVRQQMNVLEVFTGWEQNNKYSIHNSTGQQIYFAFEDTGTCMRQCCSSQRGFTIHIVDNNNQEVLKISREFKCFAGCCWCASCCNCCAHEVKVETPAGELMGYVKQKGSGWAPVYHILSADREPVFKIQGPECICNGPCCPCENKFNVTLMDDPTSLGVIGKQYGGFALEAWTNVTNFSIDFPTSLPIEQKATLLGALFLIEFMFYEEHRDNHDSSH